MKIIEVIGRQIYDSRGLPAVEAEVILENGRSYIASAPSGASTGAHEAVEIRDGGGAFFGKGVRRAVDNINGEISYALAGRDAGNQGAIDETLIELDSTHDKSRLGANATIAVSIACLKAGAGDEPLYRHIGGISAARLPRPMMNVLNGGRHADNNVDVQEFMVVPNAPTLCENLRAGSEIYLALGRILKSDGLETCVGDEGGYAPSLSRDEDALEYLVRAIETAGYTPGREVGIAIDAAASEWHKDDAYLLPKRGARFSPDELIAMWRALCRKYPIISIEDPLWEDDYASFARITEELGKDVMIVGDDLFTTDPDRIRAGIKSRAANAVLIKPNQIGTVTETIISTRLAGRAGMRTVVSHRSGETEETFIADFSVGLNADFIKSGALCRGERTAKYNRLIRIEEALNQTSK